MHTHIHTYTHTYVHQYDEDAKTDPLGPPLQNLSAITSLYPNIRWSDLFGTMRKACQQANITCTEVRARVRVEPI